MTALAPPWRVVEVLRRQGAAALCVFVVAVGARLVMVYLRGGSLADSPSYDTGVYYAAADALIHGRLPYHDFTLVHPPGIMLALTPFAVVGRLSTDHAGFALGGLCWMLLGAVNAVLVLAISRRLQLGTAASVIGALTYALWYESTRTEYALRLEPLGNFLVLVSLLAFVQSARSTRRWPSITCGVALGAAASVKIWYAVPLVLVIAWHAVERRRRAQWCWALIGAVAALVVIDGPFFLYAPTSMWHMVVTDQFGRPYSGDPLRRLANIASSGQVTARTAPTVIAAIVLVGGIAFLALCMVAWRDRVTRLPCLLVVAQLVVLVTAPTFFLYYADYLTPALALTVAGAAAGVLRAAGSGRAGGPRRVLTAAAWLPVAMAATSALLIDTIRPMAAVSPAPDHYLQSAVASARCVQSDSPIALIQLDALSRDLAHGCQLWVDVIGRTYQPPLKPTGLVEGRPAVRMTYVPWQRALGRYLLSGNAVVVLDPHAAGIATSTLRRVERGRAFTDDDGYRLYER